MAFPAPGLDSADPLLDLEHFLAGFLVAVAGSILADSAADSHLNYLDNSSADSHLNYLDNSSADSSLADSLDFVWVVCTRD